MDLLFMVGLAAVLFFAVILLTIGWHLAPLPLLLVPIVVLLVTHRLLTRVQHQLIVSNRKSLIPTDASHSYYELSYRGVSYSVSPHLEPSKLEERPAVKIVGKYRGCPLVTVTQESTPL